MTEVPSAYRTQINDVLLTALGRALCRWSDQERILIDLEGHGRADLFEDVDLSRTVGWFTILHPVELAPQGEIGTALKRVKEHLRGIPNKGLGFGALRYLGAADQRAALSGVPSAPVVFNYLGQFDGNFDRQALWEPAPESAGPSVDAQAPRVHEFSINGQIYGGELRLQVSYSRQRYRPDTVQEWVGSFQQELEGLIAHCTSGARGATPSDFPLAKLTQEALDALPLRLEEVEDLYPMTGLQQGLLFHSLRDPSSRAYVNQLRVDIEGLDVSSFKAAWQAVLERHEALRTGFLLELDVPLQWVAKAAPLHFLEQDWRERVDLPQALEELAASHSSQPFDLLTPPLMRFALVRTGENRHHLIWTHHHVLTDGWSTAQLIGEVLHHYHRHSLPVLRGRYRDYIQWLQGRDAQASQHYWTAQLRLLAEPTRLTSALPKATDAEGYEELVQSFDAERTRDLVEFAKQQRVTLNTLVQGAWALLLSRYTGHSSVSFGATTSGRPADLRGVEQLVGLFINTFPVITEVRAQQSVGEWLRELQTQNVASREHEHTPLYEIQRWKDGASEGLFDTLLVFENYPVDETLREAPGQSLRFSGVSHQDETHYPVTVTVDQGMGMGLRLRYGTRREQIDPERAAAIAQHMERLLQELAASAQRPVGEIGWLSVAERAQLAQWGVNAQRYATPDPVHQLIEARVRHAPEATALIFGETQWSYAELNRRANRLAHRLIRLGVQPETRVGIAVERSLEMVVGLLAILKTGGAYVPLEPEYPPARLGYMVQDSGISLLLTQRALRERLPIHSALPVLDLDTLDLSDEEPESDPAIAIHPDNLAYVIYTSGSTGNPKGAANRHGSLYNRLAWMQDAYGLNTADTVLQKTPFGFDVSVWEFFWPLMQGARLVIAEPGGHRDPEKLVEDICRHAVTTVHFVPSMLRTFLAHEGSEACRSLRRIVCSGEALPIDVQAQVFVRLPWAKLYNLYGPTEAAIDVTQWTCVEDGSDSIPIGRPIADTRTVVLDAEMHPVPAGIAGELYLGGIALARGYLNRPGLSSERFVADPSSKQGTRLYRTGDRVRWNREGQLEYLGRIDQQVKIRGFRIELGEIESQLLSQPEVREAAVIAQDHEGDLRLAAYVAGAPTMDFAALRERLSRVLPDYMIPSHFTALERLPLSPNGKLDRKALPKPQALQRGHYEAPQGEIEEALAAVWSGILGVERVGRQDSFFELGGHSLLALRVLERLKARGWKAQVHSLFRHPRMADFAQSVVRHSVGDEAGALPNLIPAACTAIQPQMLTLIALDVEQIRQIEAAVPGGAANIQDIYPLAPLQEGMLFHYLLRGDEGGDAYVLATTLAFDSRRRLEHFLESFNRAIDRHDILRTAVLWEGLKQPVQVVYRSAPLQAQWFEAGQDGANAAEAILEGHAHPRRFRIDVRRAPLFHAVAVHDAAGERWLLRLLSHHLIDDNTTLKRLIEEIALIQQGREAELPAPIPFRTFVALSRSTVKQAEHEAFFRNMLGEVDEPTAPFGLLNVRSDGGDIEELTLPVDAGLARGIREQAQYHGVSTAAVFHLAWALLLSKLTGQSDVVFGTVLFGRMHGGSEAERALGCSSIRCRSESARVRTISCNVCTRRTRF